MSLYAFDACVNFCLLSPGFFFFVAQKVVRISIYHMLVPPAHSRSNKRKKAKFGNPAKTQTLLFARCSQIKRCFCSRSLRSNSIGYFIENLQYNWSIITYRNSNINSVGVFHCIKLIYGTLQRRGTYPAKTQTLFFARSSSLERSVDKFDTMKNSYRICI